jgi:hypothetical protein
MLLLKKLNRKSGSTSNNGKKMETPDILHLKPNAPVDDVNSDEYNTQSDTSTATTRAISTQQPVEGHN